MRRRHEARIEAIRAELANLHQRNNDGVHTCSWINGEWVDDDDSESRQSIAWAQTRLDWAREDLQRIADA